MTARAHGGRDQIEANHASHRPAPTSLDVDITVSHPRDGQMRLVSRYFFADPKAEACQEFIGRIFEVEEVRAVEVLGRRAWAHIEYTNGVVPSRDVIAKISRHLCHGGNGDHASSVSALRGLPLADGVEGWRVERHGGVLSTWGIVHELPGRIRFRNRLIRRKDDVCRAIDRALTRVPGIERYRTNPHTATVLIAFDPGKVERQQIIQRLDEALVDAERTDRRPASRRRVPVGTASLGLAAVGHFFAPSLVPFMLLEVAVLGGALCLLGLRAVKKSPEPERRPDADADQRRRAHAAQEASIEIPSSRRLFKVGGLALGVSAVGDVFFPPLSLLAVPAAAHTTRGLYESGYRSLVRERTLTVDGLATVINVLNLLSGHVFLFALTSFAFLCTRSLLDKVKRDARADYTDIFRQHTRTVSVYVDGVEVATPLDAVKVADLVGIPAGQTIAVDGCVVEGAATVDQHLLTGEATPADKGVGDGVLAQTVVLSGTIRVRVERTGAATAAAQIARVLNDTVDFKTGRQLRAERVSERLVGPACLSGLLAWPLLGPGSGAAMLDAHPKYKTTLASALGMLNYFTLAAREGVLIKDGRTIELLTEVDTVVFDKTGTLTLAEPRVGRLHACPPHTAGDVLRLAAAAEQHQSHPVARAILHLARARGIAIPPLGEAAYKVGYGLTVTIEGRPVRVGSLRFVEMEKIAVPPALVDVQISCHGEGHSLVLVTIDEEVAGAIELHAAVRPEATRIVQALRQRGIGSMYIISGDHEAPTRRLAESLGIERYFAETLPEDKAALIEGLQASGRVVCYVGDGINDAIAMKQSHVSVSLRGASTLATDTAEVVLLDESLTQLPRLFDIARECRASTTTTMAAVFIPSLLCAAGILLIGFGFAHARLFNVVGLLTGAGTAMLPLVTHGQARRPPASAERPAADLQVEELVVAAPALR